MQVHLCIAVCMAICMLDKHCIMAVRTILAVMLFYVENNFENGKKCLKLTPVHAAPSAR